MKQFFFLLLLLVTQLDAFDLRSDIDWAYRCENWEEVEKLINPLLFPDYHTHWIHPDAGLLHFRLGVALWHPGQWKKAANCFERVYSKKYPRTSSSNRLQSLLGLSDCAHRLGEYGTSIRMAKRFLAEASPRDWQRNSPFANGPQILGISPYFGASLPHFDAGSSNATGL
ncbi:tetratricopeptide repeat protein [Akkermansiaceae bacterium]|nr:tetratricopeptide repeat protein [Akkermansiaceae bacterium]